MRKNSTKKELQKVEKQLRKNNKIILFATIRVDEPERFLTITSTLDESLEYLNKLLMFENKEHYKSWCDFRELETNNISWEEYKKTVLSEKVEKYNIIEVTYSFEDVVAILRMFGCCYPIGCSFDTDIEKLYAITRIREKLDSANDEDAEIDKDSNDGKQ